MPTNISEFHAGNSRRAAGRDYAYFLPAHVNDSFMVDIPALQTQLEQSARCLGELNAMARWAPDLNLFHQAFVSKEAQFSSRIENINTGDEELFQQEATIAQERRDDWLEVRLYIQSLTEAIDALPRLPLSNRLLQQAHAVLLSSGRGAQKSPGEYRRSQNWIGGSSPQTARYIPPHEQHLPELMGDLEKFLNRQGDMPELIRIGIAHYQFEAIHPFLDGNGRAGRMLITLFLVERGYLEKPLLYLSAFFSKYQQAYYDKLDRVRRENDLAGWLLFFLEGVEKIARFNAAILVDIINLKETLAAAIKKDSGRRAVNNLLALDALFQMPLFSAAQLADKLAVSRATAGNIIADLSAQGIVHPAKAGARNQLFAFRRYLDIFKRDFDE